ncbi:hypothetical protein [Bacillus bingmayongensis]|uniref:hypothetical protein n=1 Tax=Bacillus bingmayongensis TaxID=1150157 RepID=UPI0002F058CF|nr:hypothetical protein [Bacillus bingmayongensis]MBY0598504.1 hypothetical protein [Bacillus bingmayongensis]
MKCKRLLNIITIAVLLILSACTEKEAAKPAEEKTESQKKNKALNEKDKASTEKKQDGQKKEEGQIGIQTTVEELKQYIDKRGYILYTDHPIRRVTSEDGRTTDISNYGDLIVNARTGEPLENAPSDLIKDGFAFMTVGQDPSFQYKSWDEISNLERALVKAVYVSIRALRVLEAPARQGDFSNDEITGALAYLRKGGEFDYMAPAAQSETDSGLYEKYEIMKKSWRELANIEKPEENKVAFSEAYEKARQETNNMIGVLNILLSKNYEERLSKLPSK